MAGLVLLVVVASILLVFLTARIFYLTSKFRELDDRVGMLERRQRETVTSPAPAETPAPNVTIVAAVTSPAVTIAPAGESAVPHAVVVRPAVVPQETATAPLPPSRTREEWESLIGGKLLNRIGALALIIGVGFFLKHAIDNQWINELTRVLIGVAVGVICLWGADRTHKKRFQIFSQGLVGAGIAILYLSVYASFNFYQLVSLQVAFGLMGAVTVVAFLEAFRNDSLAVSFLACLGGLLTPVILSTSESHEVGLFAHLIALNLGVMVVLLRKVPWVLLEPLSLVGTYAIFFSWLQAYYTTALTLPALIFLVLLWAIYHGVDLSRLLTAQRSFAEFRRALCWLHAALAFAALYGICIPHGVSSMACAAAIAATLYISSNLFVERRLSGVDGAAIQYGLTGFTFFAWAISLQFESFTIALLWTIEGMLLVWVGPRTLRRSAWLAGLVLFGVTALTLLSLDGSLAASSLEGYRPLLSLRALAYVVLAASVCASVYLVRKARRSDSTVLTEALHYGWILLLFTLLTVETNDLFRSWTINASDQQQETFAFTRFLVMAVVWSLYALVLVWVAQRADIRPVLFSGISLALVAACLAGLRGIAFDPLMAFTPVFNVRVYVILFVAAVLFLEIRWLRSSRVQSTWIPELREAILILGVALLLVLFTGETRDVYEQAIAIAASSVVQGSVEEVARLQNLKQLSLSGVWLVFSVAVMAFGIWRRTRTLRLVAMALFGFTILKIFIYDLSFLDTLYRIFSFLALGLILLTVSYLYQRYRAIILGPSDTKSE